MTTISPKQTATADDVAALAGVSRWTVTRAFKRDASISEKSRAKVMEAAEKLGYAPDLQASSLASDRSNLVAVLVDDFTNPHKLVMLERLTRILRKAGFDSLLVNTIDKGDAESALLNASQRRVDSAILLGTSFDDSVLQTALGARRVKKLIIFARRSQHPNTISICVDDAQAMVQLTDYVYEKGYRKPMFMAGPNTYSAHLMRQDTFVRRWIELTGEEPEVTEVGVYDSNKAYYVTDEILRSRGKEDRPDVFVCENDAIAIGTLDCVRHGHKISVPEEIAVTGFDDVELASNPNYDLTTFRQPISEMAEALVDVLQSTEEKSDLEKFGGYLVVRSSA